MILEERREDEIEIYTPVADESVHSKDEIFLLFAHLDHVPLHATNFCILSNTLLHFYMFALLFYFSLLQITIYATNVIILCAFFVWRSSHLHGVWIDSVLSCPKYE